MYRSTFAFALAMAGLAAILLPSSLTAQATFQRTYGGAGDDEGYSAQQTTDGGYVIAGYTKSYGAGSFDVYLVKTDANGDALWTKTFGGAGGDCGFSVQQTADGGYVIAGSRTSGANSEDVYLIKTDAAGDTVWTRTCGGTNPDDGYSVRQTTDGGYIIAGTTSSYGAGSHDVYLIKTDAHGDTLWTRTYGSRHEDFGCSVQQTTDSGYAIAGDAWSSSNSSMDVCLIKTDAHGDPKWTRTYGGTDDEQGWSVQQTSDGGYIVAGQTLSFGAGITDVYLIKTNANGDTLWTRTYGGRLDEGGYSVQKAADGGYVIAGFRQDSGVGSYDAYVVKTNANGDTLWTRTFGGDTWEGGRSVQQTIDGGYIVAGWTNSFGAGNRDVYLIKTDSLGNVAVAEPKANPPRAPALSLSCEPNPFRTRTAISLQLTADSPAELAIFDAAGRCVRTFTVNRKPYTVWDGTDDLGHALPSGTYFVRLAAGSHHATTRLVLQR